MKKILSQEKIGTVFGYKQYSTGIFYRILGSMVAYGLLEKSGGVEYRVTELGTALCFPDPEKETSLKNKAILNVKLWNELFKKHGKNIPKENFQIQLKNIAKVEPKEAQKIENKIKKWYIDDVSLVTLDPLGHPIMDDSVSENSLVDTQDQHLSQTVTQDNNMSRQIEIPQTSSLG